MTANRARIALVTGGSSGAGHLHAEPDRTTGNAEKTYMSKATTLAEKIRKLREAAGLTRYKVAQAAGIDAAYYGRIEQGEVAAPSFTTVAAIAKVLGVSLDSLTE